MKQFAKQCKKFLTDNIEIVKEANKSVDRVYDLFSEKIGIDWTTKISTPLPEEEEEYVFGWTDEKDEVFYDELKKVFKTIK